MSFYLPSNSVIPSWKTCSRFLKNVILISSLGLNSRFNMLAFWPTWNPFLRYPNPPKLLVAVSNCSQFMPIHQKSGPKSKQLLEKSQKTLFQHFLSYMPNQRMVSRSEGEERGEEGRGGEGSERCIYNIKHLSAWYIIKITMSYFNYIFFHNLRC